MLAARLLLPRVWTPGARCGALVNITPSIYEGGTVNRVFIDTGNDSDFGLVVGVSSKHLAFPSKRRQIDERRRWLTGDARR